MAFQYTSSKGKLFHLNQMDITMGSGEQKKVHFFSLEERPKTACDLPEGYEVFEVEPGCSSDSQ